MASPSSESIPRPARSDRRGEAGEAPRAAAEPGPAARGDLVFVAGFGEALAADYATFVRRQSRSEIVPADDPGGALAGSGPNGPETASLVVFLPPRLDRPGRRRLAALFETASGRSIGFLGIVSSFRVHLDDPDAEEAERVAQSLALTSGIKARVVVFRPGLVLSPNARVARWLGRLGPLFPLVPARLRTCFLEGDEFFAAIEAERSGLSRPAPVEEDGRTLGRHRRAFTFLGTNRTWREMLERHRGTSAGSRLATMAARILSWLQVGQLVGLVADLLARCSRRARPLSVRTLKPRSMSEIVSLCHRGNIESVRVVGYNNGVHHFGHRHPGKTIVSTVRCHRVVHARPGVLKADCGATIREAKDYLGGHGEELFVMPNYSYVAIGTSFFVPIHGSAVDYATVADTAVRAVLYDPDTDRIVSAGREDPAFRENVYNPRSRAVLLRLDLRTRPKSSYYIRRETWTRPEAGELLAALRDRDAANVEIRQGHAASDKVTVSKYFTEADGPSGPALESPRDALGRLWDRLEENPITSFLMHALSRHVAWHTELFLSPDEFERFWATHVQVPLRKIQLRYIRRDGMPRSPFRDEDCVSADLFLFRFDKPAFDLYIAEHFPNIRCNPGKHSH